eukprot:1989570-Prymnesium_polylepis.2
MVLYHGTLVTRIAITRNQTTRPRRRTTHHAGSEACGSSPAGPGRALSTRDTPEAKHTTQAATQAQHRQGQMAGKAINASP